MKTIIPEAVSGTTFCIRCDEVLCSCITHLEYQQKYTLIDGEAYLIQAGK